MPMKYQEKPLVFEVAGEQLVGVLTRPECRAGMAVVIVVGGPQYRVGSHRQFVLLARSLAAAGYPVLRFDFRGVGDSSGSFGSFETVGDDIAAAIEALQRACPGVGRITLWGLCDGASAALLYWDETKDARLDALVLVNPWVRSEASLARTQIKHYYGRRLLEPGFWKKVLRGKFAAAASFRSLWRNVVLSVARGRAPLPRPSYQTRMARAWADFAGPILLVLSGQDYVAKEFLEYAKADPAWSGLLQRQNVQRLDVPAGDHTFSSDIARHQVEAAAVRWLHEQEWEARGAA